MKRTSLRTAAALAAAVLFLMNTIVPVFAAPGEKTPPAPRVSAQSAILLDADSGRVLYEKDADSRRLIASVTKIMTGLLICENCDLEREFPIPKEAVGVEGSSVYLKAGERCTVRQLLYGLLLQSGNDAAAALAICCDGSIPAFVERMNRRARELGLASTHFENPSGLDAETHYSTARDLGHLTRTAMDDPTFAEVVSSKSYVFGNRVLTNHNKLLWRYEGALGVKTGYTKAAGRTLVSCAHREGRRLIAVTIDDPRDWADHTALLDYGFAAYESRLLLRSGQIVARIPVIGGKEAYARAVVLDALSLPLLPEEKPELRVFAPHFVYAPVLLGPAGHCQLWLGEEKLAELPLYYREPIAETEKKKNRAFFGG